MSVSPPDSVASRTIPRRALTRRDASPPPPPDRRRWWREILLIAAFYALYSAIRDVRGSRPVSVAQAFQDAKRVIGFERTLGVFHEAQLQHALIHDRLLVQLLDDWYGSTHFLVTAGALALMFFAFPDRYRLWRNTLAIATGLALVGFALFPLMPPRLLPPGYGFTDTLRVVGGLWNFDSGPISHLSDQYAAMPSLHFAWALWCGMSLSSVAPRLWLRILSWCYPAVTLLCVLVTANHYLSDTVAGALIVVLGYQVAAAFDRRRGHPVRQGQDDPACGAGEGTCR